MLERDKYQADACLNYFPDYSPQSYINHLAGPLQFRRLIANSDNFAKNMQLRNNMIFGILCLGALPVIFHKKIYWLRNFTSRKSRILWGIGFIFIPTNILAFIFQQESQRELQIKYQSNFQIFQKVLQTGDISISNPYIQWSQY